MEYKILTIANKTEENFLRRKAAVFNFSNLSKKELDELIKKMRAIMKVAIGVGLSANQIGLDFQLFVAEIPQKKGTPKFYAIFNPKIIKASEETEVLEEGCLSVPMIYGEVERSKKITLEGLDKNQKKIRIKAFGLLARVFQHEVDHLNGILFIDRAKNLKQYTGEPVDSKNNTRQKNSSAI